MDRRKFLIAGGASIAGGLAACDVGIPAVELSPKVRLAVKPRSAIDNNARRALLATAGLPPENWEDGLALIYLGEDVITDPSIASLVELNPDAYTRALELDGASLESNSVEVKVMLSLGVPEIAEPLQRGDVREALNAMEDRGVFAASRRSELVPLSQTPLQRDVLALLAGELEAPVDVPPAVEALSETVTQVVSSLDLFRMQGEVTASELKDLVQRTIMRLAAGAYA